MVAAQPRADFRRKLAGSAAADLWAGLAQGGVRQGLQRLVQRCKLACDAEQLVLAVKVAVECLDLGDQPVEALQDCLELPVGEVSRLVHGSDSRGGAAQAPTAALPTPSRARRGW